MALHILRMLGVLAAAYGLLRLYGTRQVFIYPTVDEVEVVGAAPGGLVTVRGTIQKLRGECVVKPIHTDTILTDATGNAFIINQRSGIVLDLPAGTFDVEMHFEMPRFAVPGMGTVEYHNLYNCGLFEVYQESPAYAVEVLE
ncbi:MAG: hypothetical protein AAFR33_10150 [Pseudomonadota bacterium]